MTGMDFVKAFEWARKNPSAYGKYAKAGATESDKQKSTSSEENTEEGIDNQTSDERN